MLTSKNRKINDLAVKHLYMHDHLTCAEIATQFHVTRVAIWKALQRMEIKAEDGERVALVCACGRHFWRHRGYWRKKLRMYCSAACYYRAINNPDLVMWRQGSRIARKLVSKHFLLKPEHRVHHVDSNQHNNALSNLWVFSSASDHAAFERGRPVQPIWKGPYVGIST